MNYTTCVEKDLDRLKPAREDSRGNETNDAPVAITYFPSKRRHDRLVNRCEGTEGEQLEVISNMYYARVLSESESKRPDKTHNPEEHLQAHRHGHRPTLIRHDR